MVDLHPTAFFNMYKHRMLKLHSRFAKCILRFSQVLESLPDALRYLYWDDYPFKSLPLSFTGENLVELKLQYSKVERLWEGVQKLEKLKVIDLSFSSQLIEIPNLSQAPNIESVTLRLCERLREVPSYFHDLEKLTSLDLEDCSSLEVVSALPRNIIEVNLTCCTSLKSLPRNISVFKSLRRLELSGCLDFDYMNFREILEFLEGLE
ncbi:Leucine-rich repeat [Trema orientale]|uniref:Leucine-rich repeat n=1 Tax=Trema orientale TaxID=63057 RepID=A0A2P5E9P4_TREOI|nr:Leucine-rich repeat [Trema orientale]